MSPVPPASSPAGDNRPVRGARSCTLCRQMKSRCNATEQYPKPCSRCAHLGKEPCVIEPSFRRVNKRAYVSNALMVLTVAGELRKSKMSSSSSRILSNERAPWFLAHPRIIRIASTHSSLLIVHQTAYSLREQVHSPVHSRDQKTHADLLVSLDGSTRQQRTSCS
jgi:hypothetical protein